MAPSNWIYKELESQRSSTPVSLETFTIRVKLHNLLHSMVLVKNIKLLKGTFVLYDTKVKHMASIMKQIANMDWH